MTILTCCCFVISCCCCCCFLFPVVVFVVMVVVVVVIDPGLCLLGHPAVLVEYLQEAHVLSPPSSGRIFVQGSAPQDSTPSQSHISVPFVAVLAVLSCGTLALVVLGLIWLRKSSRVALQRGLQFLMSSFGLQSPKDHQSSRSPFFLMLLQPPCWIGRCIPSSTSLFCVFLTKCPSICVCNGVYLYACSNSSELGCWLFSLGRGECCLDGENNQFTVST